MRNSKHGSKPKVQKNGPNAANSSLGALENNAERDGWTLWTPNWRRVVGPSRKTNWFSSSIWAVDLLGVKLRKKFLAEQKTQLKTVFILLSEELYPPKSVCSLIVFLSTSFSNCCIIIPSLNSWLIRKRRVWSRRGQRWNPNAREKERWPWTSQRPCSRMSWSIKVGSSKIKVCWTPRTLWSFQEIVENRNNTWCWLRRSLFRLCNRKKLNLLVIWTRPWKWWMRRKGWGRRI